LKRSAFRFLAAVLLGMSTPALAQDVSHFKVLKLDGNYVRWKRPADGRPLDLSFRIVTEDHAFSDARNCRKLTSFDALEQTSHLTPARVHEEILAAFAMWESVANIDFHEAPAGAHGDILIGAQGTPEGWAFADVFYNAASTEQIKPISRSLVCLNPEKRWKIGFDGDLQTYDLRYTIAHEIGHAIGLDHPNGSGQIMGYRYQEKFRDLQSGDVRGIELLYGQRPSTAVAVSPAPVPASQPGAGGDSASGSGTRGIRPRSP
jgi:hypothetical protein